MTRRVQIMFVLLSWVLLQTRPLLGQQAFSIAGTAQTFHGELPDRPILVTLQFRGNTIATSFTDSEGKFSFSELSPNPYHVIVEDEKYRPVDLLVEINPLFSSVNFARVTLVPRDKPATPGPAQ